MRVRGGVIVVEWSMAVHPPGLQRRASRLPRMTTGDTGDSEADDEGWIWLVHYLSDPTAPQDTPLASLSLSPSLLRRHELKRGDSIGMHDGPSTGVPVLGGVGPAPPLPSRSAPPAPPSLTVPRVGAVGPPPPASATAPSFTDAVASAFPRTGSQSPAGNRQYYDVVDEDGDGVDDDGVWGVGRRDWVR